MVIILLGTVLGFGINIYREYKYGCWSDWFDYIMMGIIGTFTGFILSLTLAFMLPADTEIKTYTYKVESLQDNNSISGDFFLGCGQIEGKMKYMFYYEVNGMYKMKQIDYENVSIKYSNTTPKVEQFRREHTDAFINNFAIDFCGDSDYIIHVPKGTIKQNYNLDAR
jgi:hypothetical protein